MALEFQQFDPWREANVTCEKCGKSGKLGEFPYEIHSQCMDFECSGCWTWIATVWYSDYDVVETAANAGNEEAARHLVYMKAKIDRHNNFEEVKLRSIEQLPEIADESIKFSWDITGGDNNPVTVIKAGDTVIWKEPGFYECWRRFLEVKKILKLKYGKKFKELRPAAGTTYFLHGDDPKSFGRVNFY